MSIRLARVRLKDLKNRYNFEWIPRLNYGPLSLDTAVLLKPLEPVSLSER